MSCEHSFIEKLPSNYLNPRFEWVEREVGGVKYKEGKIDGGNLLSGACYAYTPSLWKDEEKFISTRCMWCGYEKPDSRHYFNR
jgi:hypothetical protein